MPDNYSVWEAHERQKEMTLAQYPVCEKCGELIQDDFYYETDEGIFCEDCFLRKYRKRTEDYRV